MAKPPTKRPPSASRTAARRPSKRHGPSVKKTKAKASGKSEAPKAAIRKATSGKAGSTKQSVTRKATAKPTHRNAQGARQQSRQKSRQQSRHKSGALLGLGTVIWSRAADALGGIKQRLVAASPSTNKSKKKPSPKRKTTGRKRKAAQGALFKGFWKEAAFAAVSTGFIAAGAALYVAFEVLAPVPPEGSDLWAVNRLPSVVILDRNGNELAARGARYGESVSVDELPPYLVKAFLSTEDRRFYSHIGVDARGITRAFFTNLRSGAIEEGGSTITQQLARNLFLSPEQSYVRKAKEALLAIWIEGRYTKDQILSLYLNRIYMGAGAYGIESAARTYFNKSARDVTLSEAVMLAGLPKAPSALAPTLNPFGAQDRALEVLENLRETGEISDEQAREARLRPPVILASNTDSDLGYFFDYISAEARQIAGPDAVDLVVRTTLDPDMQRGAEKAVSDILSVDTKIAGATQAGLVAFDNKTGAMRAMVGGRNYVESQFNRVTSARRQPGSAFKPFIFAAAFENGFSPGSRFVDQPINIAGWQPKNYSNKYLGSVRLTEAMAKSINTVAVQVSEQVGRDKVINMAGRLGFKSEIPEKEAGIALGGFNATLEELTAAYMPFARGGLGVSPYAIERIEDGRGTVLFEHASAASERVLPKKVATDMTHTLYQVMSNGTGRRANLGNRQAAGKTGTTNDWRDAWFVGYTAQLTAGVWVGNDDYQPMEKVTGGTLPAEIWKGFMVSAHEGAPRLRLDGAYAAPTYNDENVLMSFYGEIARGFTRVRRDGNEDRGARQ